MSVEPDSSAAIRRITVNDLFGRYTYVVEPRDNSNLIILYGDNGSGKTTILRLLFHLLSAGRQQGHRTSLGMIPFGRFDVALNNGLTVFADRERPSAGSYRYGLKQGEEVVVATHIQFDEDGEIIDNQRIDKELDEMLSLVERSVGADIYYIGDDRSVESDRLRMRGPEDDIHYARSHFHMENIGSFRRRKRRPGGSNQRNDDLFVALAAATEWARRQVIGATRVGTASTNSIYTDVIRRIAAPQISAGEAQPLPSNFLTKIDELEERDRDYEPFGLASGFAGKDLREALTAAGPSSRQVIMEILQPYLESVEARLEAVSSLQSTLSTFVIWMNRLLKDKYVTLRLPRGIEIFTDTGELLSPEFLSSGEQHLLLLLASTLYAQERPSLFVIDEPELSLNMKWQRQLLDVLTECTSGGSTQFVLATHSFEILAGHEKHVVQLADQRTDGAKLPL